MHKMWNDGPPFVDFMGSEGAPAVATRHLCYGGGGGGAPSPPDYSQFISAMTQTGYKGLDRSQQLFDWAKQQGIDLTSLGMAVSGKAGSAAEGQQQTSDQIMQDWRNLSKPLYEAQAADAKRMYGDLPGTEEHYAGKYAADTAGAIDQQLAAEQRKQQSYGISPGVASTAIDTQARIGRAAATTAAAEQGRMAARTEARNVTQNAINTEQGLAGVSGQQSGLATANRGQQASIPATMASTSAGLYNPSLGYYQAATPYMKAWGDTMSKSYDQSLAQYRATQENDDGGIGGALLGVAGGIGGSFFGPMGSAIGSKIGSSAGNAIFSKTGGKIPKNGGRRIPRYATGGAIDTSPPSPYGEQGDGHMIDQNMSPSGGENVDDVPAMVSAGEFVIPERTVDWYGEKFFQNLISKADNEAQQETVAAPEEAPVDGQQMAALDTMPPQFRSEGARV